MAFVAFALVALIVIASIGRAIAARVAEPERRRRIQATYSDPTVQQRIISKQIWRGMTEQQLFDSWGRPSKVTTQVLKTKVKKTYRFGNTRYGPSVYVDNGFVSGWRQAT